MWVRGEQHGVLQGFCCVVVALAASVLYVDHLPNMVILTNDYAVVAHDLYPDMPPPIHRDTQRNTDLGFTR